MGPQISWIEPVGAHHPGTLNAEPLNPGSIKWFPVNQQFKYATINAFHFYKFSPSQ